MSDQPHHSRKPTHSHSSLYRSSSTKPAAPAPAPEPRLSYVVPKIIDDAEEEASHRSEDGMERVEPDDKNQHFFSDQVKFARPCWQRSWFCMVAMTAAAIDKSAVGQFPARVADNGGAAFFIVYLLDHTILTFPMMYMEGIIGQYFQISMIGIWGMCPLFKSITTGLYLIAFVFTSFNPTVVAWAARMLAAAVESVRTAGLPWATCTNLWNTCVCDGDRHPDCASQPISNETQLRDPTEEYYVGVILKLWKTKWNEPGDIESVTENGNPNTSYGFGNSMEGVGDIQLTSVGILAGLSLLTFLVNSSRYRLAGYFYTFTTFFPLIVMTLMICRGTTLDGGFAGLRAYMKLDLSKVLDINLWIIACQSAVYSMGLGAGIHLTIASFNPLHHNLARDVWFAVLLDSVTNCMGCVVSYTFLGNLYFRKNSPLPEKYPGHGFLFPFTIFPHAVSETSGSTFFAGLYYLMIMLMAVDTCIILQQILTYSLYEEFKRKYPNQPVSENLFRCLILGFTFIFGLMTCTRGGFWFVIYADCYLYGLTSTLFPLLEIIAISWIWGLEELCHATQVISGHRPSLYLRLCWKFILPAIFCVFLYQILTTFNFNPIMELGVTPPENARYFALILTFLTTVLLLFQVLFHLQKICRNESGCSTISMLLLSPEYEHEEIKGDVRIAKRLNLEHYFFLRFPDEVDHTPLHKRPGRMLTRLKDTFKRLCTCGKDSTRVSSEIAWRASRRPTNSDLHHHHHHHQDHEHDDPKRTSLWDIAEADRIQRFSISSGVPGSQPQPHPSHPEWNSHTATSNPRIGSKDKAPPPPRTSKQSSHNSPRSTLTESHLTPRTNNAKKGSKE